MATVSRITLEVTNGSYTADLTDLVLYNVSDYAGFGVAPVTNLTQQGPMQDGTTFLGYRYKERVIPLSFMGLGTDETTWHTRRDELARIFRPSASLIQLKYSVPPDRVRVWDCYVSVPPDFSTNNRVGMVQRAVAELRAPNPFCYDPEGVGLVFGLSGGGTGLPIPLVFNMTFGASTISAAQTITLDAVNAAPSFPIITITGPINTPVITNTATTDKIQFTSNLGGGTTYTIDTRYGYKSIVDGSGVSKTSELSDDSDLSTFSLQPGDNPITITGTAATSATAISWQYYKQFISA